MTIRGANLPVYPYRRDGHATTLDDFKFALNSLVEAGANAVAFNPVHYVCIRPNSAVLGGPQPNYRIPWVIWPDVGQGQHPWAQTINPDLLYAATGVARSLGLKVALKPIVDVEGGGWRGNISVKGEGYDRGKEWQWSFINRFLDRYLQMLKPHDLIIFGTEYLQITRDLGPQWIKDVVSHIKYRFPLLDITYDANWGWAEDAEFVRVGDGWNGMKYKAVSAYFPLVADDAPPAPDVSTIVLAWHRRGIDTSWCPRIDDSITTLSGGDLGNVLFGEIGYRADDLAAHKPGEDPSNGNFSPETQVNCWEGFRIRWDSELYDGPYQPLAGWYAWSWELYPEFSDPRSHALNIEGRQEAAKWALSENPW